MISLETLETLVDKEMFVRVHSDEVYSCEHQGVKVRHFNDFYGTLTKEPDEDWFGFKEWPGVGFDSDTICEIKVKDNGIS